MIYGSKEKIKVGALARSHSGAHMKPRKIEVKQRKKEKVKQTFNSGIYICMPVVALWRRPPATRHLLLFACVFEMQQ